MMDDDGAALAALIERERDALLAEWRQKVRTLPSAAHLTAPTLNDHVPKLLDELVAALRRPDRGLPAFLSFQNGAAYEHGEQRVEDGYDIGEVVAEYSMLRGCIHTLALIHGVPIRDGQVNTLNGVLDHAICVSVHAFAINCELAEWQRRREHLACVAHDLRAPLHSVALAARVLEQNGASDEERRQMIDVLRRNVRQLSTLVESVLEDNSGSDLPGGIEQLRPRLLPMRPLVDELFGGLRASAERTGAQLLNEVPDELAVYADASMLRRVLQNLIGDALVRGSRGPVHVGAKPLDDDRHGVSCWVSDEGADSQPAPSQPPQRDEAPAGAGAPSQEKRSALSLSIVRAFVRAHGGNVEFDRETQEGRRGTVRFWLPAAGASDAVQPRDRAPQRPDASPRTR